VVRALLGSPDHRSRRIVGWNDASVGPLLLRIQDHYNVSYTIVSLLFITAFCGFFTAAVANVPINDRFGIGWVRRVYNCVMFWADFSLKAFTIGSILPVSYCRCLSNVSKVDPRIEPRSTVMSYSRPPRPSLSF
jgi:hypothetical protein